MNTQITAPVIPDLFAGDGSQGALISDDSLYRYLLWRVWEPGKATVLWIMLNPSTADGEEDDPTIRRCAGFSRQWGFGGMYVVNLFAYRATRPYLIYTAPNPVGPENDKHIMDAAVSAGRIVCAWGAHGGYLGRDVQVCEMLQAQQYPLYYLNKLNRDGRPPHPLYQRADSKLHPLRACQ